MESEQPERVIQMKGITAVRTYEAGQQPLIPVGSHGIVKSTGLEENVEEAPYHPQP